MSDPAVSRERAFVSKCSEQLDQASIRLRSAALMAPDERRSAILASVIATLEVVIIELEAKV